MGEQSDRVVMAIDPGREKCGVAVVGGSSRGLCEICRRVVSTDGLHELAAELVASCSPTIMIIGRGTNSRAVREALTLLHVPIELIDEEMSTLEARKRYFAENPPKGLMKLIPASLQTPPVPVDDYAALILAERYLLRNG